MPERKRRLHRWLLYAALVLAALLAVAALIWRDDILSNALDPKEPYQTYEPPPTPAYQDRAAWALLPTDPNLAGPGEPAADIFFISPTTYDGGRDWNAPIADQASDRVFRRVMAPNYAGPFVRVGRIFAPRYRQASLYTLLTLREDAREARRFAYGDVAAAFRYYRDHYNHGRPFVLVGVEQGGTLGARLLAEEIAPYPGLRGRLAAAYLIETVTVDQPIPACSRRGEPGCLAAWVTAVEGDRERNQALLSRSLVWTRDGQWENLSGRIPICFNPLLGAVSYKPAPARLNQGAANATGLEWGARPAFLARQVSARCDTGILQVSTPKSALLKPSGSWADRHKAPGYNLFYADLETDSRARVNALLAGQADPSHLRRID
jgi:hypothetical protein